MAITVGSVVKETTPSTNITLDPGAAANDVIFAAAVNDSTTAITFTWPASFDELMNQTTTVDGQVAGVARKKTASGSEGSISITDSQPSSKIGFFLPVSGVDNTTPEDVTPNIVNDNTGSTNTIDSGSVTPGTSGAKILAIMFMDAGSAQTGSFSTVSGSTGAWTMHDSSITDGGFRNCCVGTCDWTSGSIVVRGSTTSSCGKSIIVIVLRPAGGGSSPVLGESLTSQTFLSMNSLGGFR